VARWHAELSQFNYELKYLKGELNPVADSFSRNFEERISLLTENIAGVNEQRARKIITKRSSKYLADAHNDDLEFEIMSSISEFVCPSSVQRLTLPDDDKRAKEILSKASSFAIKPENKILYRVTKLNPDDSDVSYRRCVPLIWRKLILAEFHDSLWSGGHLGRNKTYEAIRQKFYFENMAHYVKVWCSTCEICHKTKSKHPAHPKAPLGIIDATFQSLMCTVNSPSLNPFQLKMKIQ